MACGVMSLRNNWRYVVCSVEMVFVVEAAGRDKRKERSAQLVPGIEPGSPR